MVKRVKIQDCFEKEQKRIWSNSMSIPGYISIKIKNNKKSPLLLLLFKSVQEAS